MLDTRWAPLYIKPIPLRTTEDERRAGFEWACEHLHEIEEPMHHGAASNWALFTTDPTDRHAPVAAVARPGHGGESSHFGDNEYVANLYDDFAWRSRRDGDDEAAERYHETAERVRRQWKKPIKAKGVRDAKRTNELIPHGA